MILSEIHYTDAFQVTPDILEAFNENGYLLFRYIYNLHTFFKMEFCEKSRYKYVTIDEISNTDGDISFCFN